MSLVSSFLHVFCLYMYMYLKVYADAAALYDYDFAFAKPPVFHFAICESNVFTHSYHSLPP